MKLPDGQIIRSVEWTDLSGETLKSLNPGNGEIETFRVPKEVALAETEPAKFDLALTRWSRSSGRCPMPTTASRFAIACNWRAATRPRSLSPARRSK